MTHRMYRLFRFAILAESVRTFSIHNRDGLSSTLGNDCTNALTRDIACDSTVQSFGEYKYHSSLESLELTNTVCTLSCYLSLKSWVNLVSRACAGETLDEDGTPPTLLGGYMWEGFNETCVRDPKTKKYCNDVIDQFMTVESMQEMPKNELCHTCNIRKLALMQKSRYSAYDHVYKEQLDYVYAHCDRQGPTEILSSLIREEEQPARECLTNRFHTTKDGETCESIANSTGVAGPALYIANQHVLSTCSDISGGIELCLPLACDTFYVRPSDTCESIESTAGLAEGKLRQYNMWLSMDCSNLQAATDLLGKNICVSPQGGTFIASKFPIAPTAESGDSCAQSIAWPPFGARVARGTILRCAKWHVVQENEACRTIYLTDHIEAHLFRAINPSLAGGDCTSKLLRGSAICVGPISAPQGSSCTASRFRDDPNVNDSGYAQSAVWPPFGARVARGTLLRCGKWHVVQENDECSTIYLTNHIDAHLFRAINPSLAGGDCTSKLLRSSAVCVRPVSA